LAIEILKINHCEPGKSNFGRLLILGIILSSMTGGLAMPSGSSLNVFAMGLIEASMGYQISFLQWTLAMLPLSVVMTFIAWGYYILSLNRK